ncbi:elongation factor P [bacterium]|nr:elongation factor P [bacterium]NUN44202.1 elongation factor P [bacterium]HMV26681.1 elongation factor P [bacterium]HMW32925.1 elongation factor P [bacterium]HMW36058.1 elongation factor P [bacterium]
MAGVADFRTGMTILMDGNLFVVTEFQHRNPGNWRAFVVAKLKNVRTGRVIEKTFRSHDKLEEVRAESKNMAYLYSDGDMMYFMDNESFEQVGIPRESVGEAANYLKEGIAPAILFYEGNAVSIEMPITVELKITSTVPGVKGDTVTGGTKPATLESGAVVNVPLFINEGDTVKVDTRSGDYLERVNTK